MLAGLFASEVVVPSLSLEAPSASMTVEAKSCESLGKLLLPPEQLQLCSRVLLGKHQFLLLALDDWEEEDPEAVLLYLDQQLWKPLRLEQKEGPRLVLQKGKIHF